MSEYIQKYLNDTTIDVAKRRSVQEQLKGGYDVGKMEKLLMSKYGENYAAPKQNPMQQSSTDQRSVAEKEGWMGAISSYVQAHGQPTASAPPKPEFNPIKTENPSSGAQAMANRSQDPEPQSMSIPERIQGAVQGIGSAAKEGLDTIAGGVQNLKGMDRNMQQVAFLKKQADEDFAKDGDKMAYERKMAVLRKSVQNEKDRQTLGLSQVVKGATSTAVSPLTGAIEGGLKPELEKIGELAGDSEAIQKGMAAWESFAKAHPAVANYLSAGLDVAGMGTAKAGTAVAKNTAKAAAPIIEKTGKGIVNAVAKGEEMAGGVMKTLENKLGPNMVPEEFVDPKAVGKIQKMVTPDINKKEMQQALLDQRVTRGKEGFWSGRAPDEIDVARNVKKATETIVKNIPGASKLNDVRLHAKLGETIKELSEKLKPQFQAVQLKPEIITKAQDAWTKAKNIQLEDPILQSFPGLKTAQKNFENVLGSITKSVRGGDGKFRYKNLNDLWEKAKDYDRTVKNAIKDAVKVNSESAQLYQQVWMQNREILRDFLKTEAERMGIGARKMFGEMNDYYTVQNEIFRLIKGDKGKEGRLKKIGKIAGASILGAGAYAAGSAILKD